MAKRERLTNGEDKPTATNKSLETAADVAALLRARNSLLWVVTREEARVERYLIEAAASARYEVRTWDVAQGMCDAMGNRINTSGRTLTATDISDTQDPGAILDAIRDTALKGKDRYVWILRDMHSWLQPPVGTTTQRQLRNLARLLPGIERAGAQAVIVLTPAAEVPAELAGHATLVEWPLPDRPEIASILDVAIESLPDDLKEVAAPNGTREAAVDAAVGLSGEEAQACYARSLVQLRRIDPVVVAREKKRIITRERILEWYDPIPGGLAAVGGLGNLKGWLMSRSAAYTLEARTYGLPPPRGALLVGVPGCGKTHIARATATAWNVPLLKMDMGALKSKFVGESEANIRRAFRVIEAIGRCVVLVDEIEKALAGGSQGAADGGVSSDALGSFLSWMQDRQGEAFVVATANDVSALPPELLRKGRFDELWFVDVPTPAERIEVLKAAVTSHGRAQTARIDYAKVAEACNGFTGSELAALVPDALYIAFADGMREITTRDLLNAAAEVTPLTQTASEKIDALRKWQAEGRARRANDGDSRKPPTAVRNRNRVLEV